jgi:hypothetical protein
MSGFSLSAAFGLPRAIGYRVGGVSGLAFSAGIRSDDLLYRINGRRILAEADLLEAVSHQWTGDVVPVRLQRAGKIMDLLLPLGPETPSNTNYRADDFPTAIECAVPFYPYECGAPSWISPGARSGSRSPGPAITAAWPSRETGF